MHVPTGAGKASREHGSSRGSSSSSSSDRSGGRSRGGNNSSCPFAPPYPTIIFISGFLASATDYFAYSSHLSSWGFAILQYNFDLLGALSLVGGPGSNGFTHADAAEVGFLQHFLSQLETDSADPTHPLYGQLDLSTLGAAGHSRGGKIAALHYAGSGLHTKAAYLVDPVDGTTATAGQPGYPSAVEALQQQNKTLGISGAGRIGPCNGAPYATGNWSSFWGVAAAGSWLEVVPDAGHLQFADISSALDLLCCRGCTGLVSHEDGILLAKVPMTAWFDKQLRGAAAAPGVTTTSSSSSNGGSSGGSSSSSGSDGAASRQHRGGGGHASRSSDAAGGRQRGGGVSLGSSSSSGGRRPPAVAGPNQPVQLVTGSFRQWVCREEAAGLITFEVKGQGDVCEHMVV